MKHTSSTTATRNSSGIRKFQPTAQLPVASVLRTLTDEQRERLDALITEPIEAVYDPSFRKRSLPGDDLDLEARRYTLGTLSEDGETDVLSAAEERTLFLRFNYARHRVMRVLRQFRSKRLTAAATRELLYWDREANDYRTDIVRANTSLVLAMARRSRNNGVEIGELISEGNLALLRCVDKFDAARGFKFSTYACRAILASFSRAGAKAARHRNVFPAPYDPAMERSDYLERKRELVEHDCVDELKRILFENTAQLSNVERRVLSARFLLDQDQDAGGKRKQTLDQVGLQLGVSKERVRQIQNQAITKLRTVLEGTLLAAS